MSNGFKYASAVITVMNAQPGQTISIVVATEGKTDTVSWSTGDPTDDTLSGISISATNDSPVPLTSLSINGNMINLETGGASSSVGTFTISPCMTANDALALFKIKSASDSGPTLTFAFAGRKPITLSQTSVILEWPVA